MENQAVGLAERLSRRFEIKRVVPRRPWTWLPPGYWPAPLSALKLESDTIVPPWPELVISCGRRSVPYSLYIGRRASPRCFRVHIQDPRCRLDRFDLIVAPNHDGLSGPNVVETVGALHRIRPEKLQSEAARFRPAVAALPRPLVTVLIGGQSNTFRLDASAMRSIAGRLKQMASDHGVGLAITPSRRTGAENIAILNEILAGPGTSIWDLAGDNPYFGFLGLADYIVVTGDSVSMVSEAIATGKPVYVIDLEGGSRKFQAFHNMTRERGYCRAFDGDLATWSYEVPGETGRVAREISRRAGWT